MVAPTMKLKVGRKSNKIHFYPNPLTVDAFCPFYCNVDRLLAAVFSSFFQFQVNNIHVEDTLTLQFILKADEEKFFMSGIPDGQLWYFTLGRHINSFLAEAFYLARHVFGQHAKFSVNYAVIPMHTV
eukprot:CAMPEP_0194162952 /NCGR_PEP_ID=MMETSP0152-20130528/79776_1 /TAXON_ID=1049557 /ORGANISM="Thalassiothrix antarctica, Strain L6-D1" /LENGTH=126 /DNA_ID=CAMNT_0038872895 /DNA_START=110 /DNA_END=490 /DNA_ORIENTATION=+